MNLFLEQISAFLRRLSLGQKLALGFVLLGSIAILGGVAYWAGKPDYSLLYSNLEASDANTIIEALQEDKIKYELRENGTTIYVPRDLRSELRLQFANEGNSRQSPGNSLFDDNTIGMSDRIITLNMRRAIEGELANTISGIRQVAFSRVLLVLPERTVFTEQRTDATASVMLELKGGAHLSDEQVRGITLFVAGAVEALSPENVTVLDTEGNILSNPDEGDADVAMTSNQLEYRRNEENGLIRKSEEMLEKLLGKGNAIVEVSATLDFTRTVSSSRTIDPESATVIAEERLDEQTEGQGTVTSSVRNLDLTSENTTTEKSIGDISSLTVSVIINQKLGAPSPDDPEAVREPVPYTTAEMDKFEQLVRTAVGVKEERGDKITIHQTRFDTSMDDLLLADLNRQRQMQDIMLYLRYGLMALAIAMALFLIRSASRNATALTQPKEDPALNPANADSTLLGPGQKQGRLGGGLGPDHQLEAADEDELFQMEDIYTSKLSSDAKARLKAKHQMFDEIKEQITKHPAEAADLLRSWLAEDMAHDVLNATSVKL